MAAWRAFPSCPGGRILCRSRSEHSSQDSHDHVAKTQYHEVNMVSIHFPSRLTAKATPKLRDEISVSANTPLGPSG